MATTNRQKNPIFNAISDSGNIDDLVQNIHNYNSTKPYQMAHLGICTLEKTPVKTIIHSSNFDGVEFSVTDLPDELKWAICHEAEHLLEPFNLLTHDFETFDTRKFQGLRAMASQFGVKQIMIIPLQTRKTISVAIVNFPKADFQIHAVKFLPELYQIVLAIFDQFPYLLSWPDQGKLTSREVEILQLSAVGLTEVNIANNLGISSNTVRNHIENTKNKLGAKNKLHAVIIATQNNEINVQDLHNPYETKNTA